VQFEWDPEKVAANVRKHKVTSGEAGTVLGDLLSTTFADADHSEDEARTGVP
jgi:hypothetical protein